MYIHFMTFGCKVNMYETECLRKLFESEGFVSSDETKADIFVVNSCTVTHDSDNKLFKALRRIRREHPAAVIAVTGCYPQAHSTLPDDVPADIVTGTKSRAGTVRLVKEFLADRVRIDAVSPFSGKEGFERLDTSVINGHTRAFMKIQDGCSMHCTYCIIPQARGNMRSKPLEDITAEARAFADNGYKEIVLVGINLMFYGIEYGLRLVDAIEAVCAVDGIERVRISSLEPEIISESDLSSLSAQPKFCPHFHLSLQSGSDRVLSLMKRHYDTAAYESIVGMCRKAFPDCGISADVMTGFPGETEDDHEQTLAFIDRIGFSDLHVFSYSPRENTPAALFPDQVDNAVKKRRAAELITAGQRTQDIFLNTLIGRTYPVLFEREKNDGIPHGYAPNYAHIKILTENSEKGLHKQIFYATIDYVDDGSCWARIVPPDQNII
ncbi:MAG: tRNA (N(6)-L-threonylcarbamoyladenosine(37)-C(2))-methylthiotransferase MtaB [Oscillospiraceae bacterium]|nr:tRNA (N(6)-L-threonylcarbamoyladenosine(37)-C(2))-methylthiotransferase MtaB [Oscillospiraceae bacterium]